MSTAVKGVFIVGAKRTPFGTFGGVFKNTSATQLQTVANVAALKEAGLAPEKIDSVNIGHVLQPSSSDGGFLARHSALRAGVPQEVPAVSISRLCGSSFQSIVNGVQDIMTGVAKISLTGGADSMSQMPFVVRNVRFGTSLGTPFSFEDSLWVGLTDTYCNLGMGQTAENLAVKYNISRTESDEFSLRSQKRWKASSDAGVFNAEICPVTVNVKRKDVEVTVDEHPRPQTTLEGLAKLPAVFKKDGVVTAGSSSGMCDGAGAVIVASEEAVKSEGLKPLARFAGWSVVGVDPTIMGIGPFPAIENLLKSTKLTLNDIDLIEINEAFGAQTLSCAKALKLDPERLNLDGGAISIGHPLGASGARITSHLVHELNRRGLKRAIGAACIGGGQGIAVLVESV